MGQVIVVTSGKGGVGKTTTTANIGTALAKLGKSVVLVDGDIGLRNLDLVMGLENRIVYDLVDYVEKKCRLNQALIKDKRFEELYIMPAAQTKDKNAVNPDQMKALCTELKEKFDFVIIDCPAGIEQGFKNAVAGAEKAIVVAIPEVSSIRDADRIIGLLYAEGIEDPSLVVNRTRPDMIKKNDMLDIEDTRELLGIKLLGAIPEDSCIIEASNKGEPAVTNPNSKAGKAYDKIARQLAGMEVEEEPKGFFGKIKKAFSKK